MKNSLKTNENSDGIADASGEMVWERAEQLAWIERQPISNLNYGQALRELNGPDAMEVRQALSEFVYGDGRDEITRDLCEGGFKAEQDTMQTRWENRFDS